MGDYYNVLGVARGASQEEIRAAFRREAKRCHPDAQVHAPPSQRQAAQQRFIQLAQAYETLSHEGLRRAYDEKLKAAEPLPPRGAKPGGDVKPGPASERQRRADAQRRPSPDGERQARMDEYRRATERRAEERQRQEEQARRERERAQREAQERASRLRRARAQAEAARTKPYGRVRPERPVEDIVDDVESLLARFGLDLRTPAEVVWDTLLGWARRVFRDSAPPRPARPRAHAGAQTQTSSPPRPEPPPKPRRTFRDEAEDAVFRELDAASVERRAQELELDKELEQLKRKLGKE